MSRGAVSLALFEFGGRSTRITPIGKEQRKARRATLAAQVTLNDWVTALRLNAWLRFGLVLFPLGLASLTYGLLRWEPYSFFIGFVAILAGGLMVAGTLWGTETTKAYRRAKNQIMAGKFDRRLQECYADKMYCVRIGAVGAARDCGLEDELIPRLRNNWRPWGSRLRRRPILQ